MSNNPFFGRRGPTPSLMGMPQQNHQPQANGQMVEEIRRICQEMIYASQGAQSSKLLELEDQLKILLDTTQKGLIKFPTQFREGIVDYPDRYAFPMVLNVPLRTHDGVNFGRTNDTVRANIQVDVDNPTVLSRISFDLFKPDVLDNTGIIGAYLPLSCQNWNGLLQNADGAGPFPAGAYVYQGRDFRWRIQTSSDDRIWQTGWRSSAMLDGVFRGGYNLPVEYQLRRNDTLIFEAEPIGPVSDPAQEWELNVYLHLYKMLLT